MNALLEAGADLLAQDNNKWTCLHVSIANNHEDTFNAVVSSVRGTATNIEVPYFGEKLLLCSVPKDVDRLWPRS